MNSELLANVVRNYINIIEWDQENRIVTVEFMIKPPGGRKWGRVAVPLIGTAADMYRMLPKLVEEIRNDLGDFTGDRWEQK